MTTTLNRFSVSALAASALVVTGSFASQPAQAFTFSSDKSAVTVFSSDVGKSFDVFFDGNVATVDTTDLSAKATFTFLGFTAVGNRTEAAFQVLLDNTSAVASRVSALGFDSSLGLLGVGNNNDPGRTRVTGIFTNDRGGAFPNQFGDIDVCFTNGNTCQGGGNGGISMGDPAGTFNPVLAFLGSVNTFTLSNFGVRYQAIENGARDANGNLIRDNRGRLVTSGTGMGEVPTPALLPGLLGLGVAALRKRQQEDGEVA
ncbi:MAG: cistern family PEP-CTERM protein [Tildeniella torsiva UHER 1998/13D]|jgi:hypothetical protein|nr:cistern family PEP-CTERM protein [Tildeniella torsiva UHER 1998/13D]